MRFAKSAQPTLLAFFAGTVLRAGLIMAVQNIVWWCFGRQKISSILNIMKFCIVPCAVPLPPPPSLFFIFGFFVYLGGMFIYFYTFQHTRWHKVVQILPTGQVCFCRGKPKHLWLHWGRGCKIFEGMKCRHLDDCAIINLPGVTLLHQPKKI